MTSFHESSNSRVAFYDIFLVCHILKRNLFPAAMAQRRLGDADDLCKRLMCLFSVLLASLSPVKAQENKHPECNFQNYPTLHSSALSRALCKVDELDFQVVHLSATYKAQSLCRERGVSWLGKKRVFL